MGERAADRTRRAERRLAWDPLPDPPRRYRRRLAAIATDLASHLLDEDPQALRRFTTGLDGVVGHRRFPSAPVAFRAELLIRCGVAHNWSGLNLGSQAELETARGLFESAALLLPAGTPAHGRLLINLATTVLSLHLLDTRKGLLAEAETLARASVRAVGAEPLLRARALSGLTDVLRTRFREEGGAVVMDEAVRAAEEAEALSRGTGFANRLTLSLAILLTNRYDAGGRLDDLDRAITLLRGIPATGPVHPLAGHIGSDLRKRFLRTRDPEDLDEAIRLMSTDLDGPAGRDPARLNNLGAAHLTRHEENGDLADLERAIELQAQALRATPPGDWQASSRHNNFANAMIAAWRVTGDEEYAQAAVEHRRASLELTAETAPERASREYNLANTLLALPDGTGTHAAEARTAFAAAVRHGRDHSLEWALAAARQWGAWAARRAAWTEAATAYAEATAVSHELFQAQLLRDSKELWLAHWQGLGAEAAYAMVRTGREREAVTALEASRALLLSETLAQDRADLDVLAGRDPGLAAGYRTAVAALDAAMRSGAADDAVRDHRRALDRAVERIRALDGYGDFLRYPTFADVRAAVPPGGALVYLAAAPAGGMALVVDAAGLRAVDLPAVTAAAVARRVEVLVTSRAAAGGTWAGTLDAVTRWAWTAVLAPVCALTAADDLVLVPCGRLAMLPLHAAWSGTATARRYLIDDRTVRYAPNGRALRLATGDAARMSTRTVLVVADPRPSELPPVGYARPESAWARRWFTSGTVLAGRDANRATVTAAMTGASVLHFVCHGTASPDRPMDSALVLAGDERLRLADVLAMRLRHPDGAPGTRLVVLSACDSDRLGDELPDEVVSLPTGLIQAGAAGVVGTQWPVRGEAMALLTARFYELWRTGGQQPAAALAGAQRWLRDTTNREKLADLIGTRPDADARDLVLPLLLREPDERSFEQPVHWAALSFHGA